MIHLPTEAQLSRLPEDFARLGAEVVDLRERHRQADLKLDALQAELESAPQRDAEASAKALRAGSKDPGTVLTSKAQKAVAAQEAQVRALEMAVKDAENDLDSVIHTHRDALRSKLADEESAQRQACLDAARGLRDLIEARIETLGLIAWLDTPDRPLRRSTMGFSETFVQANGEPMPTAALIDELIGIFEPKVETNPNTGRPASETPRTKGNPPKPKPAVLV